MNKLFKYKVLSDLFQTQLNYSKVHLFLFIHCSIKLFKYTMVYIWRHNLIFLNDKSKLIYLNLKKELFIKVK